jgi:hypothetical protein
MTVPRSIEQTTGGNAIAAAVINTTVAVNGSLFYGMDVARNTSNVITPAIGIGATGLTGASTAAFSALQATPPVGSAFGDMTWQVCGVGGPAPCLAAAGNIDQSGNGGAGTVNTRVLEAIAGSLLTNPFQAPFLGGVKFYVLDPTQTTLNGAGALVEVCTAGPPVNNQATNTWTYSCSYTPSALRVGHDLFGFNETTGAQPAIAAGLLRPVVAIGFNTTANGLATQPVTYPHQN